MILGAIDKDVGTVPASKDSPFAFNRSMVEAAGVEPAPHPNANWLMARDFRPHSLKIRCLVINSLCSGVLPSLGDIVETFSSLNSCTG